MSNPKSKSFKKKIGWTGRTFYEARFPIVRKVLKSENKAKWDSFSYEKKCATIAKFVERGTII